MQWLQNNFNLVNGHMPTTSFLVQVCKQKQHCTSDGSKSWVQLSASKVRTSRVMLHCHYNSWVIKLRALQLSQACSRINLNHGQCHSHLTTNSSNDNTTLATYRWYQDNKTCQKNIPQLILNITNFCNNEILSPKPWEQKVTIFKRVLVPMYHSKYT